MKPTSSELHNAGKISKLSQFIRMEREKDYKNLTYVFPQSQLNGLLWKWVSMWFSKFPFCTNPLPHCSHIKSRTPFSHKKKPLGIFKTLTEFESSYHYECVCVPVDLAWCRISWSKHRNCTCSSNQPVNVIDNELVTYCYNENLYHTFDTSMIDPFRHVRNGVVALIWNSRKMRNKYHSYE